MSDVLFSIAIPTYNRAQWLQLCLTQLLPQVVAAGQGVEVTIYDNASPDQTHEVVQSFIVQGFSLNYLRNEENIGSDRNIAQCFNLARGRYVLILGDDDVLLDGALKKIMGMLQAGKYGAIFLSAYGYNRNFAEEKPFQIGLTPLVFHSMDPFVKKCSSNAAFISSIIINRSCIADVDAQQFVGTALVQTYLFFEAISRNHQTIFVREYLVAAKRIENRDYDVVNIFGNDFNKALQYLVGRGLAVPTVAAINRKLLWYFFPMNLIALRASNMPRQRAVYAYQNLYTRYSQEPLFWLCCMPILKLPTVLARAWGYSWIIFGRLLNGEFGRLWVAVREQFGIRNAS